MTTSREARDAIVSHFLAGFHSLRSDPVAFDNAAGMVGPGGAPAAKPDRAPWAWLVIEMENAELITLGRQGNRRFRQYGNVLFDIFIPTGRGDGEAYAIADAAASVLRGATVGGVRLSEPEGPSAVGTAGAWFRLRLETEFSFDMIA